jgi:hypothetical protein
MEITLAAAGSGFFLSPVTNTPFLPAISTGRQFFISGNIELTKVPRSYFLTCAYSPLNAQFFPDNAN